MYPKRYRDLLVDETVAICSGVGVIIFPFGEVLHEMTQSKLHIDVIGRYACDDIFNLSINELPDVFIGKE